jgi:hypothetical protein
MAPRRGRAPPGGVAGSLTAIVTLRNAPDHGIAGRRRGPSGRQTNW